jgi:serine/threonine protein phosphatase PrpC
MNIAMFDLAMQGRGHIRDNIPCQDKTATLERHGVHCITLADGAGSARLSHFGAQAIVNNIAELLCESFDNFYSSPTAGEVNHSIANYVIEILNKTAEEYSCELQDLSSTLLFVAVKGDKYIAGQVGDGIIALCREGKLKIAYKPDSGEFINTTHFTTSKNLTHRLRLFKGSMSNITGFIIMSDGTSESLYMRRTSKLSNIVKNIIDSIYCKHKNYASMEMIEFFKNYIITRTTDDCSIAVMSCFNNDNDFFESLSKDELFRLFNQKKCINKKDFISEYIDIIIYCRNTNNIKLLSRTLKIRPKTLARRIRKLKLQGFKNVMKSFC